MSLTIRAALGGLWLSAALVTAADTPRLTGTIALLALSAVFLGLGVETRQTVAITMGTGTLVAAYALTLVGREGVDGRAPLIAALVPAIVFAASWAVDPARVAEGAATYVRRVLVAIGVVAAAMGVSAALVLAVTVVSFEGWPAVAAAAAAGSGALVLLLLARPNLRQ